MVRTAEVVLRIAHLVHTGRLDAFAQVVLNDPELDEATRAWVLDLDRGRERPARRGALPRALARQLN